MRENFILEVPGISEDAPTYAKASEDFRKFPEIPENIPEAETALTFRRPSPSPSSFATHNNRSGVSLLNWRFRDESTIIFTDFSFLALVSVYIFSKVCQQSKIA